MLNVHVRINDTSTGKPTPVRLRFADLEGRYYPPLGRPVDFPIGRNEDVGGSLYQNQKCYAFVEGSCEVPLPTGVPLEVEVSKGPAYRPIRETLALGEGQLSLRLAIERWTQADFDGLQLADTRAHFVSPHAARVEGQAEGLDLVNLLATVHNTPSQDGKLYRSLTNIAVFSGQAEAVSGVVVNTFNVHPALGRLSLLNCHRAVFPLTFGEADETDDWSLNDWCNQCHRKKGLVVWADAYRPEAGLAGGEGLINAILGTVDAIEIDGQDRTTPFLPIWYRLLNAGIRLPLVGGSGKNSNRTPLGACRTITPHAASYAEWIEHVRAGRTVATNGPLLRQDVQLVDGGIRFLVHAASVVPFEKLDLVVNGDVLESVSATTTNGITSARLEWEGDENTPGWIAARCWGTVRSMLDGRTSVFAHASPYWNKVPQTPRPRKPEAVAGLVREIEAVRTWVETQGRFANPRRRENLLALCATAAGKLGGGE